MIKFNFRNLVFRKDSDKWHGFYEYEYESDCLDHAAELTMDKPYMDFMPVMWRFDTNTYQCLTGDDPD